LLLLGPARYSGLGTALIGLSFEGGAITFDWLIKLLLTVLTLSTGFQGGEVTPLFAIGSALGASLAPVFGLPLPFMAALGYVSVFAAATNSFLTPPFHSGGSYWVFTLLLLLARYCRRLYLQPECLDLPATVKKIHNFQ